MKSRFSSELRLRLLSAAIAIPVLLAVIWAGGYWVAGAAALAGLIAAYELLGLLSQGGRRPLQNEGAAWAAGMAAVAIVNGEWVLMVLGGGGAGALVASVAMKRSAESVGSWFFTVIGVAYVGLPMASIVLMREGDSGLEWLAIALLATFATDSGAFAVGKLIGKHKMAPNISAGKTWEGAAGGFAAAVGATGGLVIILDPGSVSLSAGVVLGAGVGVVAQVGDLIESKLKRVANVKDSGRLIPGHGGLFDRVDSLVLVFPLVYLASRIW